MVQIEYSKKAVKYIEGLDRPTKQRIKLVFAWDSDFTKVTPSERAEL